MPNAAVVKRTHKLFNEKDYVLARAYFARALDMEKQGESNPETPKGAPFSFGMLRGNAEMGVKYLLKGSELSSDEVGEYATQIGDLIVKIDNTEVGKKIANAMTKNAVLSGFFDIVLGKLLEAFLKDGSQK